MREILRSNDLVALSQVEAILGDAGIPHVVFDANISAMEAMIGAFPRRVMVADEDAAAARRLLAEAGLLDGG